MLKTCYTDTTPNKPLEEIRKTLTLIQVKNFTNTQLKSAMIVLSLNYAVTSTTVYIKYKTAMNLILVKTYKYLQ